MLNKGQLGSQGGLLSVASSTGPATDPPMSGSAKMSSGAGPSLGLHQHHHGVGLHGGLGGSN